MNIKVMSVFGTRPEAIKMCPVVKELEKNENISSIVCVTGQHKEMLSSVLNIFDVKPDYDLEIMKANQTLFDVTSDILLGIKSVLEKERPDLVLVHGDTSTAFTTALACFYLQIPVGHVEAGLRTNNLYSPFPEEFNRQAIGLIADINFAPTQKAMQNLISENKSTRIVVTGNTSIDALKYTVNENYKSEITEWASDSKLIVLTAHRRENIGEPMRNMFMAIKQIMRSNSGVKVVYPIHMNPKVRLIADEILAEEDNIRIIEPLDVVDFHNLLNKSYLILTDSGGIQEEAPSLGKPVLVMRDTTERPEGVEAGTLKLVGTGYQGIYDSISELLNNDAEYNKMTKVANPYGDGTASIQIVKEIIRKYEEK